MFSFVVTPERPPHSCVSCGAGTDRKWYLDLGEDTTSPDEMMSTVYMCNLCFTAAAFEQNLVDQAPLLAEIEDLRAEVFNHKTKAEALEHGLDDLVRARFLNGDSPAFADLRALLEAREPADGGSPEAGGDVPNFSGVAAEPGPVPNLGAISAGLSQHGGTP